MIFSVRATIWLHRAIPESVEDETHGIEGSVRRRASQCYNDAVPAKPDTARERIALIFEHACGHLERRGAGRSAVPRIAALAARV